MPHERTAAVGHDLPPFVTACSLELRRRRQGCAALCAALRCLSPEHTGTQPHRRTLYSCDRICSCWILEGVSSFSTISWGYLQNLQARRALAELTVLQLLSCVPPLCHWGVLHTWASASPWSAGCGRAARTLGSRHPRPRTTRL